MDQSDKAALEAQGEITLKSDEFRVSPNGVVQQHQRFPAARVMHIKGFGYYYLERSSGHWVPSSDPYTAAIAEAQNMVTHGITAHPEWFSKYSPEGV